MTKDDYEAKENYNSITSHRTATESTDGQSIEFQEKRNISGLSETLEWHLFSMQQLIRRYSFRIQNMNEGEKDKKRCGTKWIYDMPLKIP